MFSAILSFSFTMTIELDISKNSLSEKRDLYLEKIVWITPYCYEMKLYLGLQTSYFRCLSSLILNQ